MLQDQVIAAEQAALCAISNLMVLIAEDAVAMLLIGSSDSECA